MLKLLYCIRSYLNSSAICNRQHFPDISAPVAVLALKYHQAQFSFMHKAWSFLPSCLFDANNNGQTISCIISPYRKNEILCLLSASDLTLNSMRPF
jgi:hypothetical protein